MASMQEPELPLRSAAPVRRQRRRTRPQVDVIPPRRTGRNTRSEVCAPTTPISDVLNETIEVVDVSVTQAADISCIDITEDDDVVCIGSLSSDVLPLRTVNRRVQREDAQISDTPQFPQLIGSGVVVNGFGPPLNPIPQPVKPIETIIGKVIKCSVCLEDIIAIESSGRRVISTNCGHVFCESCIKETIRVNKCCPTCRKKLTAKAYHPIFL